MQRWRMKVLGEGWHRVTLKPRPRGMKGVSRVAGCGKCSRMGNGECKGPAAGLEKSEGACGLELSGRGGEM